EDLALACLEDSQQPPGPRVPEFHGAVRAGGGQTSAVRAERHRIDPVTVSTDAPLFSHLVRVLDIPQDHQPILAGAGEGLAIVGKCHAGDRALVSLEDLDPVTADVPDTHAPIIAGRSQVAATRLVGHPPDKVTVSVQEIDLLAGLGVQDEDTSSSD